MRKIETFLFILYINEIFNSNCDLGTNDEKYISM